MRILNYSIKREQKTIFELISPKIARDERIEKEVQQIIDRVRTYRDSALIELTKKFDRVTLTPATLKVGYDEIKSAYSQVAPPFIRAAEVARKNIAAFHRKQKRQSWQYQPQPGIQLGQVFQPIERVGIYVPGGTAPLVSSLLMNAIPAQVAGVSRIIIATPPGKQGKINPHILVAAYLLKLKEIYKLGGAQAIAAMAYGTQTVPSVDKIVGPGNKYVTLAKKQVYGIVDIDLLAGPSEILIIADERANPAYIAADLISQAEHFHDARALLITDSAELAEHVKLHIREQLKTLPRRRFAEKALQDYGGIIIVPNLDLAILLANKTAPEHLEIMTKKPEQIAGKIVHAGAIFIGEFSPEPMGDYIAGPNHVLPTAGTARFSSGLNVDEFLKRSNIIRYSEEAFKRNAKYAIELAAVEGLTAHENSLRIRLPEEIE